MQKLSFWLFLSGFKKQILKSRAPPKKVFALKNVPFSPPFLGHTFEKEPWQNFDF